MATTIKLKNGSGAPAASDLVQGEPAFDLTNKRLYTEDSGGSVIEVGTNPSSLSINGTAITATAAEINTLDGITSSTAELNILDGVTATTAELNILDGVTSTTAELNILDGVTATAAELNILDGVTSTTAELNILDGVTATAAELNVLDGVTAFVDEDNMASDSATSIPSQQSVKAYVDSQVAGKDSLSELSDTNITTPADGALLFYDTTTSKWIDNVVSGDITIADTGVAAIGSGVIVNADVNASAAIDVSKTALTAGTGLTLSTNTLSVDASQTQITAVGTIGTGTWQGTAIADAYVANNLTISGGTVDNTVIGGTTPAAATFSSLVANSLTYPSSDGTSGQAIITDGSGTLSFGDVSGGGGITYVTKTANYTTSAGEGVIADTSGGTFTITLPATPSTGDQVIIADGGNWATTNLTVGRNGSTIEGVAADLTCDVEGISVTMVYDGSTWQLYPQTGTSPSLGIDDNADAVAITIDSNENVSIGTATAGVDGLSISATKNLGWTQSSGESLANMFRQQSSGALVTGYGYQRSATANGFASSYSSSLSRAAASFSDSIRFYVDTASTVAAGTDITPTERMRIDGSGNVGIGRTPGYRLDVEEASPANGIVQRIGATGSTGAQMLFFQSGVSNWVIGQPAGDDDFAFWSGRTSAAAGNERMRIDNSGNLLVGKTSNTNSDSGCSITNSGVLLLSRDGTGNDTQVAFYRNGGTTVGTIKTTGSATSYNTSSDYRLKENVVNLTGATDRLNQIPVHRFNFIAYPDVTVDGFLAHEVADVVPEAISGAKDEVDEEGNPVYQGIDQSKLVPLLTAALQEALTKIESLETRVSALEAN